MEADYSEFTKTIKEVRKLHKEASLVEENFIKSTGGLSECFKWILRAELRNSVDHCCFGIKTCTNQKAQQLKEMGFNVTEMWNERGILYGYNVSWEYTLTSNL